MLLEYFYLIDLVGIRIYHMDSAGDAWIKGMNSSKDFQGVFGVCDRCPDESFLHRTQLPVLATWP